jgi:DNA-binding CsgD family transcriptional regulator
VQRSEALVGRDDELAVLDRVLAGLDLGAVEPNAVEFAGEPGVGKTRLLVELAARAEERGFLVLAGRASEFEHELPFWVFVDALDHHLAALDADRRQRLGEDMGGELGRVFPSLGEFAVGPAGLEHERFRAHRAVCELLERLAAATPVVLMLDDLHWADPASVELLGALLRRPPRAAVLIAIARRQHQTDQRLAFALADAYRARTLERLELRTLTRPEVATFLGDGVEPRVASRLHELSGGNPFYLEQLSRAARRTSVGAGPTTASESVVAGGDEVPPLVAATLAEELTALSADARLLLDGAAVAGDPFDADLAAAAAALPIADALGALDELLRLDVVRPTGVARQFGFRHPLLRHATYKAAPPGWRLAAHERAGRALAGRGAPPAMCAHHVEQSAGLGDRAAIELLRAAGDATAQRAPEDAVRWYTACLRLVPQKGSERAERIELLHALAGALAATGRFAETLDRLVELLDLVPPEAAALRVRATIAAAVAEQRLGRHDHARQRLTAAVAEQRGAASPEALALMTELSLDAMFSSDFDGSYAWGERALAAATRLGEPSLIAAATAVLALAAVIGGRIDEAEVFRARAAAAVDGISDAQIAPRLDAIANVAAAEMSLDRYRDALRHTERGIALARSTGQGRMFPLLIDVRGRALMLLGRLDEATVVFDEAIEIARLSDDLLSLGFALLNRTRVAALVGDVASTEQLGQEAVEITRRLAYSFFTGFAAAVRGWALLEADDAAACVEVMLQGAGGDDLSGLPARFRAPFQEVLTRAWLALGRDDKARTAAARAELLGERLGQGLNRTSAYRARGEVLLAGDEPAAAADHALAAAALADELDAPIEAARSLLLAGRALVVAGDEQRAAEVLERAALAFDRCGATRYRAATEQELRRVGRRVPRPAGSHAADVSEDPGLTERELEVAWLAREGRKNREIAVDLFLSEKTVESHLRNVFRKLGISSRAALAGRLETRELKRR